MIGKSNTGGGKSSSNTGNYAWRRWDGYVPAKNGSVTFSDLTNVYNSKDVKTGVNITLGFSGEINNNNFTTDLLTNKILVPYTTSLSTVKKAVFKDGSTITLTCTGTYGDTITDYPYTYNQSTNKLYIGSGKLYVNDILTPAYCNNPISVTIPEIYGTFIGFVVSDDSSAYPNGAVHTDGYYYELLASV